MLHGRVCVMPTSEHAVKTGLALRIPSLFFFPLCTHSVLVVLVRLSLGTDHLNFLGGGGGGGGWVIFGEPGLFFLPENQAIFSAG